MSCIVLLQDTAESITVYLTLSADGSPATGLTFSDVSVDLKKFGEATFSAKVLSGANFTEISDGFYELLLSATDLDTLGNMYVRISGATINTTVTSVYVAESAPVSSSSTITVPQTDVFGYVLNAQGSPVANASISVRVLANPTVLHPGTEGIVINTGLVTAKTGSDGFFVLSLITGAEVDVFISAANYRRTFIVPSSSTNLFDIP